MQLYRSVFTLRSASATPWHADTVFGHLCWSLVHRYGESKLLSLLEEFQSEEPPFFLSDGFPADYLPRPLITYGYQSMHPSKRQRVDRLLDMNRVNSRSWLTLEEFNKACRGDFVAPSVPDKAIAENMVLGLRVGSQTNRMTGLGRSIFYTHGQFIPEVTIYWRINRRHIETVEGFLKDLQVTGFGKRRSVGYGCIESHSLTEFDGFAEVKSPNAFVTLCAFVPAMHDPKDGFWNITVKYGKLGGHLDRTISPFKRPLIKLGCGSCFYTSQQRDWYGQMLSGLTQHSDVRQYAYAFPVPARLPVALRAA